MGAVNNQGYKFNTLAELFPQKIKELAESKNMAVGELRELIHANVYYIDDACNLIENPTIKAWHDFGKAMLKHLPTTRQAEERLAAAFGIGKAFGIAGEDLKTGDCVALGKGGKIYKARQ